jgi:hypothetical protein
MNANLLDNLANKNPSNAPEKKVKDKTRIPMSVPQLRLAVPEIPGYHLHWMLGTPARLAQAQKAGYTFVEDDEADVNNFDLGGDASASGNSDMGSRVSLVAGGDTGADGEATRLYLMKLPESDWESDQAKLAVLNDEVAANLRGDNQIEEGYIPNSHKKNVAELFRKKK